MPVSAVISFISSSNLFDKQILRLHSSYQDAQDPTAIKILGGFSPVKCISIFSSTPTTSCLHFKAMRLITLMSPKMTMFWQSNMILQ